MNVTITKEEAQSIIDIACGTWKEKLFGLWGKQIVLNKPIEVTEEFYKHFPKKQKIWIEVYRGLDGRISVMEYYSEEEYNDRWAPENTIDCIIKEY